MALISSTASWPACPPHSALPSSISMVMLLANRVHFHNFLRQANRDIKVQKKMSMHTHVVFQLYVQPRGIKVRLTSFVCVYACVLVCVCVCVRACKCV